MTFKFLSAQIVSSVKAEPPDWFKQGLLGAVLVTHVGRASIRYIQ